MTDQPKLRPRPPEPLQRAPAPTAEPPPPLPGRALAPPTARPTPQAVTLTIRGRVTLPTVPGYARRLATLIEDLQRAVEEQAPWLRDLTVEVDR